jgi:LPXTG-motif cell wall-anchored protein
MVGFKSLRNTTKRFKSATIAVAFLATQLVVPLSANGLFSGRAGAATDKVTICHRTKSVTNPYVSETVSVNAVDGVAGNSGKKADHYSEHTGPVWDANTNYPTPHNGDQWGDIIPPVAGVHEGLNWTTAGQAIYDNGCEPVVVATPVTADAVTYSDSCGTANDTYTVPTTPHITYSEPAGMHAGAGIVTVTASADQGYILTEPYSFEHLFTNETCPIDNTPVAAQAPASKDLTCKKDGFYTIPEVEGVQYKVEGANVDAGKYTVKTAGTVHVTAEALDGYILTGTSEWDLNFTTPENCKPPKPPKVTICHATHAFKHPYVEITVNQNAVDGVAGNSGNKADHYGEHNSPLFDPTTMQQGDTWGDIIPAVLPFHNGLNLDNGGQAILDAHCVVTVPDTEVTPATPTFVPPTCENNTGSYTIPTTTGVKYKVNGVVTPAGTYPAVKGTSITITAVAKKGYVLADGAKDSWNYEFTVKGGCVLGDNDVCPNILGPQTTVPDGYTKNTAGNCVKPGKVLGSSTELPNTGANTLLSVIAGTVFIALALGTRFVSRREYVQS